ncbi:hypothetical protein I552_6906 [Mycobacterium xenopi 3993]|nr:hypothetical protein I552_6906 [Mycobacterium xenopi 3993]
MLADAGISSLIIDPTPMFVERALGCWSGSTRSSRSSPSARCRMR